MEKENTHASAPPFPSVPPAPPFPSMLPNLSAASVNNSFVIKIIIVKEGSSEEDYDSVNLYELISKNDFKKLKKEYEYRIKSYKILTLTPVSLQNADHTEKQKGKKGKQTKKRKQPKKIRKKRTGKQSGKRSVKYKGKYKGKQSGKRR